MIFQDKKLIYVCEDMGSVFHSQVMALLLKLKESNLFNEIVLLLGIKEEKQKSLLINNYKNIQITVIYFRSFPNFPFYNFFTKKEIKKILIENNFINKNFIYHIRGERIAYFIYKILKKFNINSNIIADIRGASIEEVIQFYRKNMVLKYLKVLNYKKFIRGIKRLNKISVVSEALKNYLIKNFRFRKEHISVIPCLAGEKFIFNENNRKKKRKELNLSERDTLFVFSSGGEAGWQNFEVIKVLAEKGYKILNLSKKKLDYNNIINKFVSYSDMPIYLCAADIAIIWRVNNVVNQVASPAKFCEYVCCGLPVISNDAVHSVYEFIRKYNIGVVLNSLDQINNSIVNDLLRKDRDEISQIGSDFFSVKKIIEKYFALYKNN